MVNCQNVSWISLPKLVPANSENRIDYKYVSWLQCKWKNLPKGPKECKNIVQEKWFLKNETVTETTILIMCKETVNKGINSLCPSKAINS